MFDSLIVELEYILSSIVQEHREPVEPTQDSPEPRQNSQSENSKSKSGWLSSIKVISGIVIGLLTATGAEVFIPKLVENRVSESTPIESQTEIAEQTEPWSAVFKTRDGDEEETEGDEQLQLSFENGNVEGSSTSTVDNVDKEWSYTGQTDGSYLALVYKEKNTPVLGTVLMRKRAEGEYVGYWEGKLCSNSNVIVKCPYVLVKGNSRSSLSPEQEFHLDKPCIDTVFDGSPSEASAGNPCS